MLSSFILKHVRVIAGILIGLAVSGLSCYGGFVEGKKHGPPRDVPGVTTEKVVEKQTQVINQKVDMQELAKLVQDAVKNVKVVAHVTTKTVKAPDGTVTTEQTTDTQRDTHSEVKTDSSKDTKSETQAQTKTQVDRVVEKRVEVFVPQLRQPTWNIGVGIGANVPALLGRDAPTSLLPFVAAKYAGSLKITHHLLGPAYWGGQVNTRGDLFFVLEYAK